MDLPTLDILYKNNHIICGILSLALPCFQVSSMLQYFIPTYGQIVFHWIYHLLFTHSSFDGHLGCFHFLPIMNNAEVDLNEQIFVWTYAISFTRGSRDSPIVKDVRIWSHLACVQSLALLLNSMWLWVNGLAYMWLSFLTCKIG